jgi:ribose transport system substrate-binding protein
MSELIGGRLKMKKTVFLVACIFVASLILAGCGNSKTADSLTQSSVSGDQQPTDQAKKLKIALVMKTLTNPFFIEMEKGARKAEREFGINLIVKTGAKETSIEQQIEIVEELITMKVDAIVIAPGSSTELVEVLKKAQDANIVIVNIDNRLDPDLCKKRGLNDVPFISVRNDEGAYLSAKYISGMIKRPEQAAIIEGIRAADNAQERKKGALRAFAENPNIKLVDSETANWKIDEAYTVALSLFKHHPEIKAVFCANDMMALGMVQYLRDTGRHDVLVAGFDDLAEARVAIKEGTMAVTIDQQADLQGYTGVKYALKMINGGKIDAETYIPVKQVTKKDL